MARDSTQAASTSGRIDALEGLRGIAILLVLAYHVWLAALLDGLISVESPIDRVVFRIIESGWVGVDLFFVLSGFLITRILLGSRHGERYFRNFYARRSLRIFPIYYAVLAFYLFIVPRTFGTDGSFADIPDLQRLQVWYWTYTDNWLIGLAWLKPDDVAFAPHSHLWSLAVEEQFYLLWPAVVLLLSRGRLATACVLLIVQSFLVRGYLEWFANAELASNVRVYFLTPTRIDGLAFGALIAIAAGDAVWRARMKEWAATFVLIAVGGIVIIVANDRSFRIAADNVQTFGLTFLALLFGGLTMGVVTSARGFPRSLFEHSFLRTIGKYSYGVYLLHIFVIELLQNQIDDETSFPVLLSSSLPALAVYMALVLSLSLGLAWLSWRFFENPILGFKRYFPYGEQARAGDTAVLQPSVASTASSTNVPPA